MGETTHIEWTDATWNPITGCSVVSPGCTNCYAMKLAGTRLKHHPSREGLTQDTKAGPVWTGEVRLNEAWLDQPLRWSRARDIFVCAHSDLFHPSVPDAWIDRVFARMALARQHTFQVLTKRSERMREYLHAERRADRWGEAVLSAGYDGPLEALSTRHICLGASVEDQTRADERREAMQSVARLGWTTFVSYEPALGQVDWTGWEFLRWLICGGENGPRPMHPAWPRAARDFCAVHGIPFFFKQWGSSCPLRPELIPVPHRNIGWVSRDGRAVFNATDADYRRMLRDDERHAEPWWAQTVRVGKKAAGRLLDGVQHDARPEIRA
jgi:protein gp37